MEKTQSRSLPSLWMKRGSLLHTLWLFVPLLVFLFVCLFVLFCFGLIDKKIWFYSADTTSLKFLNLFLRTSVLTQRFLPHPQAGRLWPVSVCPPQGPLQPWLPSAFLVAIAHPHGWLVSSEHFSGYSAFVKVIEETKNFPVGNIFVKHYVNMVFYR